MPLSFSEKELTIAIPTTKTTEHGISIARAYVQEMLKIRHMTLTSVVRLINERYPEEKTTTQNLSNKLARGTLKDYEIAQIADVCGFQLQLVGNIVDEIKQTKQIQQDEQRILSHNSSNDAELIEYISEGYTTISSDNFGVIVFAGKNAADAAQYFLENRKAGINPIDELALCTIVEQKYNIKVKPSSI